MSVNSSTITDTTSQGTDPLSQAGRDAGETAGHLAERATDLGFRQADRGKDQAADGLSQVAQSIRRVSGEMEGQQPAIANVAQTAAEQADRLASYLRDTDAREMLDTVENMARRQPILFLGGAFLLGFAASRLIKAASGNADTWQGYGSTYRSGSTYPVRSGYGATDEGV